MDVLLCRSIRCMIVDICECIYGQEYNLIYKYWDVLEQAIMEAFPEDEKIYLMLNEIRVCIERCNFLRVRDILTYGVDLFLFQQLNNLRQSERKYLIKEAKHQNDQALRTYHKNIWELLWEKSGCTRIECDYSGTENVSISILERNVKYRLFSDTNPWLESSGYIDAMEVSGRISDEMYVLGFGGGYVIEELEKRYPKMKIKVFIPNLDILEVVVSSISLSHVLQNKNLELNYEPMWLSFFITLDEHISAGEDIGFFIDRQELRACTGSEGIARQLTRYYTKKYEKSRSAVDNNTGKIIYKFINDNPMHC